MPIIAFAKWGTHSLKTLPRVITTGWATTSSERARWLPTKKNCKEMQSIISALYSKEKECANFKMVLSEITTGCLSKAIVTWKGSYASVPLKYDEKKHSLKLAQQWTWCWDINEKEVAAIKTLQKKCKHKIILLTVEVNAQNEVLKPAGPLV